MEITRLDPFLEYFDRVHQRTRRVIECIPPADLEWGPAPGRFTLGDLIRHLAGIERYMYAETVQGRASAYPGHGRDLADGWTETLAYHDRLHAESRSLLPASPTRGSPQSASRPPTRRSRWASGFAR